MIRLSITALGFLLTASLVAPGVSIASFEPEGAALLGATAQRGGPAGWSDRRSILTIEVFEGEKKTDEQRVELKESLGEDLELVCLAEILTPGKLKGARAIRLWSPSDERQTWVWSPFVERFQKISAKHETKGRVRLEEIQVLDIVPRMAAAFEIEVVSEETIDGLEMMVLDLDAGESESGFGRYFRVWVSAADGLLRKLERRSSTGAVAQRISVLDYSDQDGRQTPTKVEIQEEGGSRRTVWRRSQVEYDRGIPATTFDVGQSGVGD